MELDPNVEYGISLSLMHYSNGQELLAALKEDAKKTLPQGTKYQIIAFDSGGQRVIGWIVNQNTTKRNQTLEMELTA